MHLKQNGNILIRCVSAERSDTVGNAGNRGFALLGDDVVAKHADIRDADPPSNVDGRTPLDHGLFTFFFGMKRARCAEHENTDTAFCKQLFGFCCVFF